MLFVREFGILRFVFSEYGGGLRPCVVTPGSDFARYVLFVIEWWFSRLIYREVYISCLYQFFCIFYLQLSVYVIELRLLDVS